MLGQVVAAAPIGERKGESAWPLALDRRHYAADHAHAGGVLAIELLFDGRGRIVSFALRPRTPLSADPGAGRDVRLALPVAGTWWVFWGGCEERQNRHAVAPDQRHAYDLVTWRRRGTARRRGTRNEHYFAFDRRVLAPADGLVVEARDGVRDNRPQVELRNPRPRRATTSCLRSEAAGTSFSPIFGAAASASASASAYGRERPRPRRELGQLV